MATGGGFSSVPISSISSFANVATAAVDVPKHIIEMPTKSSRPLKPAIQIDTGSVITMPAIVRTADLTRAVSVILITLTALITSGSAVPSMCERLARVSHIDKCIRSWYGDRS